MRKKASKKFRDDFAHTPLSVEENIPWRCTSLIIGTGAYARLPVMVDVRHEADQRGVRLIVLPTAETIELLKKRPPRRTLFTCHLPMNPDSWGRGNGNEVGYQVNQRHEISDSCSKTPARETSGGFRVAWQA